MLNGKRVIAIIPARGGSKRLPKKNILPLGGKPLIGWTIEAAKNSAYVDDIFISTDDQEIADVVSEFGITVPELRPEELSTDTATTQSVLFYTLEKYAKDADIVILLQPTSPLRTAYDIDSSLELWREKSAFSIISVCPCEHPPEWSNSLPSNLSMARFLREDIVSRSQDYIQSYRLNGALYIYDVKKLLSYRDVKYRTDSFAYIMKQDCSIDIDTEFDFDIADLYMKRLGDIK
ncbi:acylneuraminate cytidylyltransferase family protein [Vibrio splendidus]